MTASNHTYSFLSGRSRQPSNGTGIPQSMSLVIARGRRSSSRFSENRRTLGRQSVRVSGQGGQVEEVLLGLPEDRGLAVDLGLRVDQVDRIELVAAVVALVAARTVI